MRKPKVNSQKKLFNFKAGDIVEWIDNGIKHEGEITANAGFYKYIKFEGEKVKQLCKIRENYYRIMDFADCSLCVIHGFRLSKCTVKVKFD